MRPKGFIVPAQPIGAKAPPAGPGWLHELKHDGFRIMAYRAGERVELRIRNGISIGGPRWTWEAQ